MRKLAISIIVASLILVSGCTKADSDKPGNRESVDRFYYLDNLAGLVEAQTTIIVDKQTRVCYLFQRDAYKGGLVVMIDANGDPLLYEGAFDDEQ